MAVAEAQAVVEEGITTLKVKVGVDAARDIALVERLRQTLGPDVKLRVDANQGYRTWKEALRVTRVMAGLRHLVHGAAVRGAREHGARGAGDRRADHGRRERLERARRAAADRVEGGRDGLGLLHQARRTDEIEEAARGRRDRRAPVRHQRLGRDGRRQRRQPASRRVVAASSSCRARSRSPRPPRSSAPRWPGTNISTTSSRSRSSTATAACSCRTDPASASRSTKRS